MILESDSTKSADDWFREGVALGRLGNNGAAIQAYENVVKLDPRHFKAYFNMGIRYGKIPMNLKAAESFRKALEIKPDDIMTHYSLAVVSNLVGETDEAFEHYGEAIRLNPSFAKAYSNLAMLHYTFKRGKPALENLVKAKQLFMEEGDQRMAANADNLLKECYREFGLSAKDFEEAP